MELHKKKQNTFLQLYYALGAMILGMSQIISRFFFKCNIDERFERNFRFHGFSVQCTTLLDDIRHKSTVINSNLTMYIR